MENTIGIDISKDKLDAYWLSKGEHKQFDNDKTGVKSLVAWANDTGVARVIFESTGIYHRRVETGFADDNISFARGTHARRVLLAGSCRYAVQPRPEG